MTLNLKQKNLKNLIFFSQYIGLYPKLKSLILVTKILYLLKSYFAYHFPFYQ